MMIAFAPSARAFSLNRMLRVSRAREIIPGDVMVKFSESTATTSRTRGSWKNIDTGTAIAAARIVKPTPIARENAPRCAMRSSLISFR